MNLLVAVGLGTVAVVVNVAFAFFAAWCVHKISEYYEEGKHGDRWDRWRNEC